jgi:hypothetical protein
MVLRPAAPKRANAYQSKATADLGDLGENVLLGSREAGDLCSACDGASAGPDVRRRKTGTSGGTKIEFSFKVKSEVQDAGVCVPRHRRNQGRCLRDRPRSRRSGLLPQQSLPRQETSAARVHC